MASRVRLKADTTTAKRGPPEGGHYDGDISATTITKM
jgi:hypothetical protein